MEKQPCLFILLTILSICSYAQWQQTDGPPGGYIRSFLYESGYVYAASGGGTLVSAPVLSLRVSGTLLYAGVNAGGVWKRLLYDIVGIKERNRDHWFSTFPNPAHDILTVELQQTETIKDSQISITDLQGNIILQEALKQARTDIDLGAFAKGLYFIRIARDKESFMKKFVKE
jgi:hypothetical protein